MEQGRVEDLKRIQALFKLVNNPQLFSDYRIRWKKYIYGKGEEMLNDEELAKKSFKAIEDFIEFRTKSVQLVELVF